MPENATLERSESNLADVVEQTLEEVEADRAANLARELCLIDLKTNRRKTEKLQTYVWGLDSKVRGNAGLCPPCGLGEGPSR